MKVLSFLLSCVLLISSGGTFVLAAETQAEETQEVIVMRGEKMEVEKKTLSPLFFLLGLFLLGAILDDPAPPPAPAPMGPSPMPGS